MYPDENARSRNVRTWRFFDGVQLTNLFLSEIAMSRSVISIVVMLGAVTTMAAAARNCTEAEERELARRHARCVDSGRYTILFNYTYHFYAIIIGYCDYDSNKSF